MRVGTAALVLAATVSIGFVLYDLTGLPRRTAGRTAAEAAVADDDRGEAQRRQMTDDAVRQQVAQVLAERAAAAARSQTVSPAVVANGLPRTDTPAEFAEIRDEQYRDMIQKRVESPELTNHDGVTIEDLMRMKEKGVIVQ